MPVNKEILAFADGDGGPELTKCPEEGCEATDGLWLMECAPGTTWVFVNDCGHWGFITKAVPFSGAPMDPPRLPNDVFTEPGSTFDLEDDLR